MWKIHQGLLAALSLAALALLPASAAAYSNLYVFGDSLSDSGNAAFYIDHFTSAPGTRTPVPLAGPSIPDFPYASGRLSNGPVWVESFANSLGLSARPSLSGGTNYAFAGARTGHSSSAVPGLADQVGSFLGATSARAPHDGLYVLESGGNDVQDVFATVLSGGDPRTQIQNYAQSMASGVAALWAAGADQFLVWNIPDLGKAPVITAQAAQNPGLPLLASTVTALMNDALRLALSGLAADIADGVHLFDIYSVVDHIVGNPGAFGFTNATDACATSAACIADPQGHFFWDGIHPTAAGHAEVARLVLAEIPEPATLLLLLAGLMGLSVSRRRAD